jgi:CBS domain-containing protein
MPNSIISSTLRDAPTVTVHDPMSEALGALVESGLPAIPVLDDAGRLHGIFGEREFITALFPGYLDQLGYAGFVTHTLDETIDRRSSCVDEPVAAYVNTEHVDVGSDAADAQIAEVFLHHRVLIVPVTDAGRVVGVVTRSAFFRALAERVLNHAVD